MGGQIHKCEGRDFTGKRHSTVQNIADFLTPGKEPLDLCGYVPNVIVRFLTMLEHHPGELREAKIKQIEVKIEKIRARLATIGTIEKLVKAENKNGDDETNYSKLNKELTRLNNMLEEL